MGMFDDVYVQQDLVPGTPIPEKGWYCQTKDFDCLLDTYTITREGTLIQHTVRHEQVPEQERPYWGKPEWERGGLFRAMGCMRCVPTGDVGVPFHGDLSLYLCGDSVPNQDYTARFDDGKLRWLRPTASADAIQ
jgi:hypothetical protein